LVFYCCLSIIFPPSVFQKLVDFKYFDKNFQNEDTSFKYSDYSNFIKDSLFFLYFIFIIQFLP
jgi:hypothetical protein